MNWAAEREWQKSRKQGVATLTHGTDRLIYPSLDEETRREISNEIELRGLSDR
jgi:hypothetical protein